ncbi:MAG TPA: hypothetical protein VE863_16530 [Pyrinomonadaceae bacterium]|jgi:hypothetical protein|nr:hypothetical protein [Pyrinomonadaceae bacterium]
MPYQNIDASISAADLQDIRNAFATIKTKLPFLVALTVDERKATFKTGPNSLSFVQNCLAAAKNFPQILPPSFDVDAFERDVDLVAALTELNTDSESLNSQIDDTRLAVGGEAMEEATQVYKLAQVAAKTVPGLKAVVDQLNERFQRASKPKADAAPAK